MPRLLSLLLTLFLLASPAFAQAKKKVIFIAGKPSHGFGAHDHSAGCHLLAKQLNESGLPIEASVITGGFPKDLSVLDGADAIVVYSDGGGGHPAIPHLDHLDKLMAKGVGYGTIHYAVEVPKGKPGEHFLKWQGGYFETHWSVNPHWVAGYEELPKHDVTRGVKPFTTYDEWYYHMRFREDMKGVTPILTALPPEKTREGKDGPHSGNPAVRGRKGQKEHTLWVATREGNDGRGFGTTGGHVHWNWANDNWRTLVLNCVAWIAKVDVPETGVPNKRPTVADMLANHDEKKPDNLTEEQVQQRIDNAHNPTRK